MVTLNNAQFETTDAVGAKVYGYQSTQGRTVLGAGSITPFMLSKVFDVTTKIYDGSTTANVVNASGLGPLFAGDVVSATYGSADYNSKDVVTANQVTILGGSLVGPDARNYSLPAITRINAVIAPKTVSLSASKIYDGSTNLSGAVDVQTGVGNEVLAYTGAVANDAHVSTLNKYVEAINLTDGTTALQSNYRLPSLNNLNAPALVLARPVTAQAAIVGEFDKVFNNDVDVDPKKVSLTGQVNGAVPGDALVVDFASVGLSYVSKQVGSTQIGTQGLADFTLQSTTLFSERSDYAFTPPVIDNVAARINSAFTVPPVATLVQVQAPQVAAPVSTPIQGGGLAAAPAAQPAAASSAGAAASSSGGGTGTSTAGTTSSTGTSAAGGSTGASGAESTAGSTAASGTSASAGSTEAASSSGTDDKSAEAKSSSNASDSKDGKEPQLAEQTGQPKTTTGNEPTVQLRQPVEGTVEIKTESSPPVEIRTIPRVVLDGAEGVNRQVTPLAPQTNVPEPVRVQIQPN